MGNVKTTFVSKFYSEILRCANFNMTHTRSQTKNPGKKLKRNLSSRDSKSEPNRAKIPKIIPMYIPLKQEETPKESSKNHDGMAKRIENLESRIDKYESSNKDVKNVLVSNMEGIDGLNSKLDKIGHILNCMTEKKENPVANTNETQIYYPFYGNMMSADTFFDTEGLMTTYGMTGRDITFQILSYLDFETMVNSRLVSKTWYRFLENERGLWIELMRKAYRDFLKKRALGEDWIQLGELIAANGDNVADIITLLQRFVHKDIMDFGCRPALSIGSSFASKSVQTELNFLKMLKKYNYLHGLEQYMDATKLVAWSLRKKEALETVLSIFGPNLKFEMKLYGGHNPSWAMWSAIRQKEMSLEKVKMLIPFVSTKRFWNSGKVLYSQDHTPLADAIMVGNIEVVKLIIPYTRIEANPKYRFVSYLHVAVKFGQTEIFKIIFQALKRKKFDWLKLRDKENRSAYDILKDERFQLLRYGENSDKGFRNRGAVGGSCIATKEESDEYKPYMMKFIESLM